MTAELEALEILHGLGSHNLGIYMPTSTTEFKTATATSPVQGDKTVVKLVDYDNPRSPCEVYALRLYTTTFISSGYMIDAKDNHIKKGVIVMRKSDGVALEKTAEWEQAGEPQRRIMMNWAFQCVEHHIYMTMIHHQTRKAVHVDTSPSNLRFDYKNKKCDVLDYGPMSVFHLKRVPTAQEYHHFHKMRWIHLWHEFAKYLVPQGTQTGGQGSERAPQNKRQKTSKLKEKEEGEMDSVNGMG